MSFVRTVKRENPFIQVDRHYVEVETNLSLKATGLLTYFLAKPDGWQIRLADVKNRFTDGDAAIRSGLEELRDKFYVNRYRSRNEDGTFGDYIYEVYERPEYNPMYKKELKMKVEKKEKKPKRENQEQVNSPKRDFPILDNPSLEKPILDNQAYSNNHSSNNHSSNNKTSNNNHHLANKGFTDKQLTYINMFILEYKIDDEDMVSLLINRLVGKRFRSIKYIVATYESIVEELNSKPSKLQTLKGSKEEDSFIDFLQGKETAPEETKEVQAGNEQNVNVDVAAMLEQFNANKKAKKD